MECTLCLTAFARVIHAPLVLLEMFRLQWLNKLDVPSPSASCWVERRQCTRFTSSPLTFVTVGGSKNSQVGLVCFRYTMALFWLSVALLVQLLFFTCASRRAALFPCRYGNGSGNEIKKTKYLNPSIRTKR